MKKILTALIVLLMGIGITNAQIGGGRGGIGGGGLWFLNSTDVEPVDSSWNIDIGGDIKFSGDLMPDGLDCSNGEILQKTGANNWDCVTTGSI